MGWDGVSERCNALDAAPGPASGRQVDTEPLFMQNTITAAVLHNSLLFSRKTASFGRLHVVIGCCITLRGQRWANSDYETSYGSSHQRN